MPPLDLDEGQRRVVEHGRGPMRVRGAAGTGKTAALRQRFLRLVVDGDPERVALVVRSRREADEARRAIQADLRVALPALRVVTVHALARHVLERRFADLGYRQPPRILTASDQFALVRDLLADEREADWPAYGGLLRMRGFADEIRQFLSRAQEGRLSPETIDGLAADRGLRGWHELAAFYRRYLDVLAGQDDVDFAGLVWQASIAAGSGEPLLDHVLLDDLQDTTESAAELLVALRAGSTVVAGDEAAHVFSFQGTTVVPFRTFAERMPGTVEVELARRWRGADLRIERWHAANTSEEHAAIARELRRIHVEEDVAWRDLAVVVRRQGANLAAVVRALDDARVPHHVPEGGVTFTTEPSTWPFALALTWIADEHRRDELVGAVLTSRLAGLSPAAARGILRAARARGLPPSTAIGERAGLTAAEALALDHLADALAAATARADNVGDAFMALWHGLPVAAEIVDAASRSREDGAALDTVLALSEAVNVASEGPDPSVEAFVAGLEARGDTPDLARLRDSGADAVQVLTAHAAAGREFDTVIVAGAVEGDFPSLSRPEPMFDLDVLRRVRSESERNAERLADERRLFDVVLSRARRRALLTASDAPGGERGGAVSRFAADVPSTAAPEPDADDPVSVADAVRAWRRILADRDADDVDRVLALDGLLALGERPERWWLLRDWSEPATPYAGPSSMSFSRMRHLLDCELRYLLTQELGLGGRLGYQGWLGSTIHGILEDVERGRIERSPESLARALEERWDPSVFPSRAIAQAQRRTALGRMLPTWWAAYGARPALAVERPFAFEVDGMRMNGVIDRIDAADTVGADDAGGTRITDYKTGTTPSGARTGEPGRDDALQLATYLLAVHRDEGLAAFRPVRRLDVAYVRGENAGGIAIRGTSIPADELDARIDAIEEEVRGHVARIRELAAGGEYRPSPSHRVCNSCDVRVLCPLYEGAPLFPVATEPPDGEVPA
ncbi:MAG: PD-(D/E)XK nuclease family protein [Actinomycetota bacterium]